MNIEIKKASTYYMALALKEAEKAFEADEVPVGAVIVHKGEVIARAHNQIVTLKDPTAHAEMIAITQAANHLRNERLIDCELYTTIEPCPMCTGAMILARIKKLVFAAADLKTGACGSVLPLLNHAKMNHKIILEKGVMEEEARALIQEFFRNKRKPV